MKNSSIALVVPTIREHCMKEFIMRWDALGLFSLVDLIIMEDNPEKTFDLGDECVHLCWTDIERRLKGLQWIIPRRSDTVRSFAYWYAWNEGYQFIMTMDDDCYPPVKNEDNFEYPDAKAFVNLHVTALLNKTKWFNTLNNVKPRGVPFYELGRRSDVIVNHGLWTKVLDYDAPTQLVNPVQEQFSFDNKIVPCGSYFPMCGMNVMWDAKYTPWMYHLLMGRQFVSDRGEMMLDSDKLLQLPFDRFGDIWCGIFMKRCADLCDKVVSTGMPYIRHERASNPFANLKKEANGLEVNEKLWQHIDNFKFGGPEMDPSQVYAELGMHVQKYEEFPQYVEYFKKLGEAMQYWARLFNGDAGKLPTVG